MAHPIDAWAFWKTVVKQPDEVAEMRQIYDNLISKLTDDERASLHKLIQWVCHEASCEDAFNNSGADQ